MAIQPTGMPGQVQQMGPGMLEQMALQNPDLAARLMAARGVPPPQQLPAMAPAGAGADSNALGMALQGVQATQAPGMQQPPPVAPQQGSVQPGGLEALMALALGQQQQGPPPSLGQLLAGG